MKDPELMATLRDLVRAHGAKEVIEALRDAADAALDVEPGVKALSRTSAHLANAANAVECGGIGEIMGDALEVLAEAFADYETDGPGC